MNSSHEKLKEDGFEPMATLWCKPESSGEFAFSVDHEENEMPDSGEIIRALITILDGFEQEFVNTGFRVNGQTFTWPARTREPKEIH